MSEEAKLHVNDFHEGWAVVTFTTPAKDDDQRCRWLDEITRQ